MNHLTRPANNLNYAFDLRRHKFAAKWNVNCAPWRMRNNAAFTYVPQTNRKHSERLLARDILSGHKTTFSALQGRHVKSCTTAVDVPVGVRLNKRRAGNGDDRQDTHKRPHTHI